MAHAQVSLDSTVTPFGAAYLYDYSVVNNSAEALALTSLTVVSGPNALFNFNAPVGFLIDFDSGLGLVSFLEDNDPLTTGSFAPGSTVSGFSFSSNFASGQTPFTAIGSDSGTVFQGNTLGPKGSSPVPEVNSLFALCSGLLPLFGYGHWRRGRLRRIA